MNAPSSAGHRSTISTRASESMRGPKNSRLRPVPPPSSTTTLPGGRYAVVPFKGTTQQIVVAWKQLLGEWLPASRLQLDNRPCFEHYPVGASYDPVSGVFECEICIPVAPL